MKIYLLSALLVSSLGSAAYAADNMKLNCDDNNIFETPLIVKIVNGSATANGSFSGPGDAIFNIHYAGLDILSQNGKLSIVKDAVSDHKSPFTLDLDKVPAVGQSVEGHIDLISSDHDHMSYSGQITCKREG